MGQTRGDAMLAAVLADPEDAATRAVYADHLSEAGDPRGELIQVQSALAALPFDADGVPALRARVERLLKQHKAAWLAPLKPYVKRATFARGFPESIEITAAKLVEGGAVLARLTPVASLTVTSITPALAPKVAASPLFARATEVSFAGAKLDAKSAPRLFATARFPRARTISLAGNYLRGAAFVAFAGAIAGATALRVLDLDDTGHDNDGIDALDNANLKLTHLGLLRNPLVSGMGMERLASAAMLATVRDLNLFSCNLQYTVRWLAECPHLGALERLILHRNAIPTDAARTLLAAADAGRFPKLAELWIHDNAIAQKLMATFRRRFPPTS